MSLCATSHAMLTVPPLLAVTHLIFIDCVKMVAVTGAQI